MSENPEPSLPYRAKEVLASRTALQILFNRRTYLRDSDLLCTPMLQQILMDGSNLGALLDSGTVMLGLRTEDKTREVLSFSHLNDLKGPTGRAYRDNFQEAVAFCAILDKSIESRGVHVASVELGDFAYRFRTGLDHLMDNQSDDEEVLNMMRDSLNYSICSTRDGAAVFSKMLEFIGQQKKEPDTKKQSVIQRIRAAHNVAEVQAYPDFRLSMEDEDIHPTFVAIAMGLPRQSCVVHQTIADVSPKQILDIADIENRDLGRLATYSNTSEGQNYFSELEKTRTICQQFSLTSTQFGIQYVNYCRALDFYIKKIGIDENVRLHDTQSIALNNAFSEFAKQSERFGQYIALGVFSTLTVPALFLQGAFGFGLDDTIELSAAGYGVGRKVHQKWSARRTAAAQRFRRNTILDASK